jgi:hypothetical protein
MQTKYSIKCRFGPVGDTGPLIPNLNLDVRILTLEAPDPGYIRKGLTIDHLMIFDMQEDGGVDVVEILHPLGPGLRERRIEPDPKEEYERLFLEPSDKDLVELHAQLEFERAGHLAIFRIAPGTVDKHHLIGPGVNALVGNDELRGISVDLIGLMK